MEPTPLEIRERHYEEFFGPITEPVVHSIDSKVPHIDIYQFAPHGERDFWTLITGGMSDEPQFLPDSVPEYVTGRTEIMMYVRQPEGWMFNVLKGLAGMPFDDLTFLHWWHSVPNGKPMTVQPSGLTNFLFLPPYHEDDGFDELKIGDTKIHILWLVPITDAELKYKLDHGAEALLEVFDDRGLDIVVDEDRQSLVERLRVVTMASCAFAGRTTPTAIV